MDRHFEQVITYADTPFTAGRALYIFADTTDGAITVNLTYSQDCRQRVHYIVNTGATNAVTIQSLRSGDTINSAASYTVQAGDVVKLYAGDTEWEVFNFVRIEGSDARVIERTPATPDNFGYGVIKLRAVKSSNMGDGFGSNVLFQIEDDAAVENTIVALQAIRNGADNTGKFIISAYNAGSITTVITCLHNGVMISNLKSGATQVAAGASANELWVTASHATLPDRVVMIGA